MDRVSDDDFTTAGFYREAWLIVARGGWWKPAEIVQELPLSIDGTKVHTVLWHMTVRHRLLAARGRGRQRQYAVTQDCGIPSDVSAGEVALVLTGKPLRGVEGTA